MSLAMVGISHRTAPLEVRERFVIDAEESAVALRRLAATGCGEAVLVSTCNRTELYMRVAEEHPDAPALGARFLADHARMKEQDADRFLYTLHDEAAVEHLFRVVSSLDSLILGEAQIQGQVKAAYERATASDFGFNVGPVLARLFESALKVGGRVRHDTRLGTGAASIPSAAIDLARKIFGNLKGRRVLVLGAGEMSELTVECLRGEGVKQVLVANRTAGRAEEVAARLGATALPFGRVPATLAEVDILVSATAAPHPVITRAVVAEAQLAERNGPLLVLDIALPRDVEPEVGEQPNVFLYDIDDLSQVVEGTLERRRSEVTVAETIVREGVRDFWHWYRGRDVVPTIRDLRGWAEHVRETETRRALQSLQHLSGKDQAQVEALTRQLLAKVLHAPTTRLRESAAEGSDPHVLEVARYLFGLDDNGRQNGSGSERERRHDAE
jgi:glutamyl-tRNA reductase